MVETAALVALILIGLTNIALLAVLIYVALIVKKELTKVSSELRDVLPRVASVADQAKEAARISTEVVNRASQLVERVGTRIEAIADTSEKTIGELSKRFKVTGRVVQESIIGPLIEIGGFIAGVRRGLSVLATYKSGKESEKHDEQ
jgi:hypothetical protein